MRLQVKHSKPKGKTEKQKKINKEKKSKGPKIREDYYDMKEYRVDRSEIDLTRLTYGIINSCEVKYIITPDGYINLDKSWIELVLLMLSTAIKNNPDNFLKDFGQYGVTSQTFSVDKIYGKYTFDKDKEYKVYEIMDTKYYLEAIFSESNLFSAIVGLSKLSGIALDKFKMGIEKKGLREKETNFDLLEDTEHIVGISGVAAMIEDKAHLVGVSIMGVNTKLHRLDVVLWCYCNWIKEIYGEDILKTLPKDKGSGVSLKTDKEDVAYMQLKNSEYSVYTDFNNIGIIQFIKLSMDKLNIGEEHIKFKFRKHKNKNELKEWEIG